MISILICLSMMVLTFFWWQKSHPKDLPPTPSWPYPIFGHALEMRNAVPLHVFHKWKRQLGGIFTVYIGSKMLIVISNYDIVKEMIRKKEDCFYEKAEYFFSRFSRDDNGKNRFLNTDWKGIRKATLSIFKEFGVGKEMMAQRVTQEVNALLQELHQFKGKAMDIHTLLSCAVINVIFSVLVGRRYDYNDPFYRGIVAVEQEFLHIVKATAPVDIFEWFKYLPTDPFQVKKLEARNQELLKFFSDHNSRLRNGPDNQQEDNFFTACHKEMRKSAENTLREEDLAPLAYVMLIAGSDSTSTTIWWILLFAMNHPDLQRKIYEEIKEVVGTDRLPNVQDRKRLIHLNAFISETQRFRNIIPIIMPRLCTQSTTLGGYRIPVGAQVVVFTDAISNDETLWGDPGVFRPGRFINELEEYVVPDFHLPFILGKRSCAGEGLAVMELFLFCAAIFQRFEVLPEDPNNPPLIEADYTLTCSPLPFQARFVERRSEGC